MKIYVAAKVEEAARARVVADYLEQRGHCITFKWWEHEASPLPTDKWPAQAVSDLKGIEDADALVVVFERDLPYRGTLCEFGAALALNKPVYVLGDQRPPFIFLYHPLVRFGWPEDESE